jgi:DNA adenine methylase
LSQLSFFNRSLNETVNVASVPQRSPFRYPGGKTWLIPRVRDWMRYRAAVTGRRPRTLIEPFAGGGIVSLTVAAEKLADRAVMVELDEEVVAVWQAIFSGEGAALSERIMTFDVTLANAEAVVAAEARSTLDIAFRTIVKNRTYHGGILAPGSGFLKHGENGKGIRSRWYPETLKKRILAIHEYRERLEAIHGDAFEILGRRNSETSAVWFIDPPYTAAGKKAGSRLYTHFALDHDELFRATAKLKGDFLMTYDHAEGVLDLAREHGFDTELIAMKNTHHATMKELLIGRDLSWARGHTE